LALAYRRTDFVRALLLSGIVGSWLVALNQGGVILDGRIDGVLFLRILLNYATPFTVSSFTGILRNWSDFKAQKRPKSVGEQ